MPYKKSYVRPKKKVAHRKRPIKNNRIQSVVIRTPGVAVPDKMFVQLNYMDTTSRVLAAAGNPFGYIRYFSNGMFDANPLILTSPIPGFTELAALYEQYRVHSIKVSLRFCNQETFPSVVVIWPTDQDQSGLISQSYLQEMCGNAFAKYKQVSSKGGLDAGEINFYLSHKKLIGTKVYNTANEYSAFVTANPARLTYVNVGCYSMDNSNYTAANIPFEVRLTYYAEFYNRKQLTT